MVKITNNEEHDYRYVEVMWDDAVSNSQTWAHLDDIAKPERIITRGWLVVDEPSYVSIASSVCGTDGVYEGVVGNTLTVPRGMIVDMFDISATRKRARKRAAATMAAEVQNDPTQ